MATTIKAPYPNSKVTIILPNPQFDDARASESKVIVKRTMTGRAVTYVNKSERVTLTLPFQISRMKSIEFGRFLSEFQEERWLVTLYDGSKWDAYLTGTGPLFTTVDRMSDNSLTGKELVAFTLTLSAVSVS